MATMALDGNVCIYGANSGGEEGNGTGLGLIGGGLGGTIGFRRHDTIHNGDINPSLLPNGAVLENSADAAATPRPRPDVFLELGPSFFHGLDRFAHAVLCFPYHLLEAGPYRRR